jgi:pyruvate formate lyase activating enzyme
MMSDPNQHSQPMSPTETPQVDPDVRGLIGDIDHFAIHDGPGIRTAVFLKGCPLHCIWCHSPETQSFSAELLYLPQKCTACGLCFSVCQPVALSPEQLASGGDQPAQPCRVAVDWQKCTHCAACTSVCYTGALKMSGTWMSVAQVVEQVAKDQPFFIASGGGVTLTGGEATAQPNFALHFLSACRSLGIHTALETNGCAPWGVYQQLLQVVDLFLYDLKHMNETVHRQLTGASQHLALSNLRRLAEQGAQITVRVPCIPGINDDPANIEATAAFVRQIGLHNIQLLPYNVSAGAKYHWLGREYSLGTQPAQTSEKMDELAAICRAYGLNAQVEG